MNTCGFNPTSLLTLYVCCLPIWEAIIHSAMAYSFVSASHVVPPYFRSFVYRENERNKYIALKKKSWKKNGFTQHRSCGQCGFIIFYWRAVIFACGESQKQLFCSDLSLKHIYHHHTSRKTWLRSSMEIEYSIRGLKKWKRISKDDTPSTLLQIERSQRRFNPSLWYDFISVTAADLLLANGVTCTTRTGPCLLLPLL